MPDPDLALRSATALAKAIRARQIGCRELLEHYVARVERLNGPLNAVVTLDLERARRAADAADAAIARGDTLGALHGLPITIKDTFETAGLRTTAGFPPLGEHEPADDAVAVARLRAAGSIVFGKTNVPVLAGDWQTYNPVFGITNNPWDRSRTPGGSSGGAAAAVATGLTAFELGSDIGGSIRVPSHWCGVVGHKPSFGIVPQLGHIPGPPGTLAEPDLNVVGPIARSVDDLELLLDVIAGPMPEEGVAWRLELPAPRATRLGDFRLAAWLDDESFPVEGEVRECLERTLATLRSAGARIDERARPDIALRDVTHVYTRLLYPIILGTLPQEQFDNLVELADQLPAEDESPLARSARFATLRHREWMKAHEERTAIRSRFSAFFRDHDALLCPVNQVPAIPHDHSEPFIFRSLAIDGASHPYIDLFGWIAPATMAHLPATVIPAGRTRAGLPVGLQIVGPRLEDRTPLAIARAAMDVLGPLAPPPGYA